MAKIFDVQDEIHESPNRNNFPLSHKRHTSGKFGIIYPFLCQPVNPTDAWEIDTAIGINLNPMWYPTQTNMRFIVHYFSVPYRLLWKDWKNTIEGLEEHDFPWIDQPAEFYKTGSLADHLGIPTAHTLPCDTEFIYTNVRYRETSFFFHSTTIQSPSADKPFLLYYSGPSTEPIGEVNFSKSIVIPSLYPALPVTTQVVDYVEHFKIKFNDPIQCNKQLEVRMFLWYSKNDEMIDWNNVNSLKNLYFLGDSGVRYTSAPDTAFSEIDISNPDFIDQLNGMIGCHKYVYFTMVFSVNFLPYSYTDFDIRMFTIPTPKGITFDVSEQPLYCPYAHTGDNNTNRIHLKSLAFRAYEMIYNSYYRNSQGNQPFVVDGVTQYNNYLTTDESGSDMTNYELKSRNWELDAYTSCLPSPQQGDAPLIGVTLDGRMRISHDDGTTSELQLQDLENGERGLSVSRSSIDPAHPEDARTIISLASSGITIADIRNGNALTRFLETSLRSGFRYADFIFGHFGKSPSHQELDMPIFLGGYTQVVDINKISNVSASGDAKLGEFAGVGSSFGMSSENHTIRHYFDDFGLVIGVMALVPDAAYSQVLPKHFTYDNRLDYYFPEFSQLGLQPITYEELCPIQSYAEYLSDSSKHLTDTFGYQRPNHDMIWLPDTCHGLFRTALKDSVINRVFGERPVLGDDFLKIKPEECNGIFSVREEDDDVWTGQVAVKITAQRPIPRFVIPSLGR